MSKVIRKQQSVGKDYAETLREYFGFHLTGLDVNEDGGETQVQLVYCDYKHIDTVRRELAQMLPEVEFVKIRRDFTESAMLYALKKMMGRFDPHFEEPTLYVKHQDGTLVPTDLMGLARTALRRVELDEDDDIQYSEFDMQVSDDDSLRRNVTNL